MIAELKNKQGSPTTSHPRLRGSKNPTSKMTQDIKERTSQRVSQDIKRIAFKERERAPHRGCPTSTSKMPQDIKRERRSTSQRLVVPQAEWPKISKLSREHLTEVVLPIGSWFHPRPHFRPPFGHTLSTKAHLFTSKTLNSSLFMIRKLVSFYITFISVFCI